MSMYELSDKDRISNFGVIVDERLVGDLKRRRQITQAPFVSATNVLVGHMMSAPRDTLSNPANVLFCTASADIHEVDGESSRARRLHVPQRRSAGQGRLQSK
jgi:hypothetical protein